MLINLINGVSIAGVHGKFKQARLYWSCNIILHQSSASHQTKCKLERVHTQTYIHTYIYIHNCFFSLFLCRNLTISFSISNFPLSLSHTLSLLFYAYTHICITVLHVFISKRIHSILRVVRSYHSSFCLVRMLLVMPDRVTDHAGLNPNAGPSPFCLVMKTFYGSNL